MLSHRSNSVFVLCSMAWNKLIIVEKLKSFMDDQNEIDTRVLIVTTYNYANKFIWYNYIMFSNKLSRVDTFLQSRMLRKYNFWPDPF